MEVILFVCQYPISPIFKPLKKKKKRQTNISPLIRKNLVSSDQIMEDTTRESLKGPSPVQALGLDA